MSRYWTDGELAALRDAFEQCYGMEWHDAVDACAARGSVNAVAVLAKTWARIAERVGTRTAKQCANRLQTELTWIGRRPTQVTTDPGPLPEPALPLVEAFRPTFAMTGGRLACVDVSPYLGQASGRIVLSFNGRGAA